MEDSIYSSPIFVGRELEKDKFKKFISSTEEDDWLLTVIGPGGIGKTQLLGKFIELVNAQRNLGKNLISTNYIIDLYMTTHKLEIGILKSLADSIAPDKFKTFYDILKKFKDDPEQYTEALNEFLTIFKSITADQVILFFDTFEIATVAAKRFFLETLPKIRSSNRNLKVIIASQNPVEIFENSKIVKIKLSGFLPGEINNYLLEKGFSVSGRLIEQIHTLSRGHPLLVGLIVDWMNSGHDPSELLKFDTEEFDCSLVNRIQQLYFPEDQVILAMAHLSLRFNSEILSFLFNIPTEKADKLIISLSKFSFVKYRQSVDDKNGSCLLHDAMRELVNKCIWPSLDPLGNFRIDWSRKILKYYDERIIKEDNYIELFNLKQERLYYALDSNLQDGLRYWLELLSTTAKYDEMEALNSVVKVFSNRLSDEWKLEIQFQDTEVLYRRGSGEDYQRQIKDLNYMLDNPMLSDFIRAKIHTGLVAGYGKVDGGSNKAISYGLKGVQLFRNILANSSETTDRRIISQQFGSLLTVLGYAYRQLNLIDQAVEYFKEADEYLINIDGDLIQNKINLSYASHLLGMENLALSYCKSALRLAQNIKDYYRIGLANNVLGIIHHAQLRESEAANYFEAAIQSFETAENRRGLSLVFVAYSRLIRQQEQYKERTAKESLNPERNEYQFAHSMLDRAIKYSESGDRSTLSELWNEKGVVYRQQGNYPEAIKCFVLGKKFGRVAGNQYQVADNIRDIAITNFFNGKLDDDTIKLAEEAKKIATELDTPHLYASAQRVEADVLYSRNLFNEAFSAMSDSSIHVIRDDRKSNTNSSAQKERLFDEWLDWIQEKIINLPSIELRKEMTELLISNWKKEELNGVSLNIIRPEFSTRFRDLMQYP